MYSFSDRRRNPQRPINPLPRPSVVEYDHVGLVEEQAPDKVGAQLPALGEFLDRVMLLEYRRSRGCYSVRLCSV